MSKIQNTWYINPKQSETRVLVNGYQSWSNAEIFPILDKQVGPYEKWRIDQGFDPVHPPSNQNGVWRSHTIIALINEDSSGWVGCAMDERKSLTMWEVDAINDETVKVTFRVEQNANEDVPVIFKETDNVVELVEELSKKLGDNMGAKQPIPLRVWCSWYYYYHDVKLSDIFANADFSKSKNFAFDVFQVDDGYQAAIGDWLLPRKEFEGNAKDIPPKVHALGYKAGIWLAPFLVSPDSELFHTHSDWCVKDEIGNPLPVGDNWGKPYYVLDCTQDSVLDWLKDLGQTMRIWGFEYFKIDFLFAGAYPGYRSKQNVTRAEAFRMGLNAFRNGVGSDAFILGCGAPLASSIGYVDAMRTGPDVTNTWDPEHGDDGAAPSTKSAIKTCLARWYQKFWFLPDPDVMIARKLSSQLSDVERTALLALIDTVGGLRATSDPLHKLSEDDLIIMQRLLEISKPDTPANLNITIGHTVSHFKKGIFNLHNSAQGSLPPHSFTAAGQLQVIDSV